MDNSCINKNCEPASWDSGSFEHRLFALLMRINRLLHQHIMQNMTAHALSPAQLWFLKRLDDAGTPQPIGYFADGVFSNRSNATQMIDRLQAEELVSRIKNPKDRRSVLVELTDLGAQRLLEAHQCHERLLQALFASLTEGERAEAIRIFEGLLNLLQSVSTAKVSDESP